MRHLRRALAGLPRRAWLTLRHLGLREFARRVATFPRRLARPSYTRDDQADDVAAARDWYRTHGTPVCIVIPTYGDPGLVIDAVRSLRATTQPDCVRIVVADDGSQPRHLRRLRRVRGIELVEGAETRGFAANCNRGIERLGPDEDLVLLNSDVVSYDGWLESLQYTARNLTEAGIVGPKLLYADGTIQSAGSVRNADAPEWFDHRYRFRPASYPPANVVGLCLAVTGAAMYVRRDCLEAIGGRFDEGYGMAFEDADWCLRAWDTGWEVVYCPFSVLTHLESKTRGMKQGERELDSQRVFWERWGRWLNERDVVTPDGRLRIAYVTEHPVHHVVLEHIAALRAAGHDVELHSGGDERLEMTLEQLDAFKVATSWRTAETVWSASVKRGIPVYFVEDMDHDPDLQARALDSYRLEFRYLTTSDSNAERLRDMHIAATVIPGAPAAELERFYTSLVPARAGA